MNVLMIGSGGREHALAWKLAHSKSVDTVFVAPGNAGTADETKCHNVDISPSDFNSLVSFAKNNHCELTVVGPESPLVDGIVDRFSSEGLICFGPTAAAAQLEGSKAFTKDFLARHQIPTGTYETFTDADAACAYIRAQGAPIVVKADGLAAGKGVIVASSIEQAEEAARDMLSGNAFGDAGARVVIEEFLDGEEASFIVMVDGTDVLTMATSQDHKRVGKGDTGPNTGGMGAYSPAPVVTPDIHERVMNEIIYPTVQGMLDDGNRYRGFLYAGLMIDSSGAPKVIEFNCRFGDPETQPIMMRLDSDLAEHCLAACEGRLALEKAAWSNEATIGIVLASEHYPSSSPTGLPIQGLTTSCPSTKVFHAGTRRESDDVLTAGGRVLCVTAKAETLAAAADLAYEAVTDISWDGMKYRSDIGWRALQR
jgi:phosphoribosylamine--glycine ligase